MWLVKVSSNHASRIGETPFPEGEKTRRTMACGTPIDIGIPGWTLVLTVSDETSRLSDEFAASDAGRGKR
jgi:hypothetical protein